MIEKTMKRLCSENGKGVSEVINYLCRLFLEDADEIQTKFFKWRLKKRV